MEDLVVRNKEVSKFENRSKRLKLTAQKEPHWTALGIGQSIGYYRPMSGASGTWSARFMDMNTKKYLRHALGTADDFLEADEVTVLSFDQAQDKARDWFKEMKSVVAGEPHRLGPLTVEQAWIAYAEDAERRGKKSIASTKLNVIAHILPAFGTCKVADLTRWKIEKWHAALAKSPARIRSKKGQQPASKTAPVTDEQKRARRATANRILTALKAILNFVKHRGMTRANAEAWREVKPFEGTTASRQRFLTPEEAQRLVNVCPPDFRRLVQGGLFTGARFGELSRLVNSDFNAPNGKIHIAPSKSNPNPRYVVLTEEGQIYFKALTAGRLADEPMFLRESNETRNWTSPKVNRPWRKSEPARCMKEACEAASLATLTFHELRHTHASGLVNNGVPLAFVASQLGHLDTRMVERHYGHLAPSAMADAIRALAPKLGIHDGTPVETLAIKQGNGK